MTRIAHFPPPGSPRWFNGFCTTRLSFAVLSGSDVQISHLASAGRLIPAAKPWLSFFCLKFFCHNLFQCQIFGRKMGGRKIGLITLDQYQPECLTSCVVGTSISIFRLHRITHPNPGH
jgi:hypothetical protein